jgi:hypothetical protein
MRSAEMYLLKQRRMLEMEITRRQQILFVLAKNRDVSYVQSSNTDDIFDEL